VPLSLSLHCVETRKVFLVSVACWVDSGYGNPSVSFSSLLGGFRMWSNITASSMLIAHAVLILATTRVCVLLVLGKYCSLQVWK
jgi:hypothetical protein